MQEILLTDDIVGFIIRAASFNKYNHIGKDMAATKKRASIKNIHMAEERYRHILNAISDGYYEVDLKGDLTFFNRQMADLYGYSESEMLGMSYKQYMDEETSLEIYKAFNEIYKNGKSSKILTYLAIRKDASRIYIEISVSLLKNKDGKKIGFMGTARDVTERKLFEETMKRSEERYHTILDAITDGYYEVDLKGCLTFYNKQMADLYGYPESEIMGMCYKEYMSEENAGKVFKVFNEVYMTGKPSRILNYTASRKDGTKRYIEISVSPIKNQQMEKIGFRGIARDISERKAAEEALRQSEKRLKERNEIIESDLETAKVIQKSLISSTIPRVPEVLIDYKYFPLEAVGGDYFSFTPLREGGLGVFIGDVANHGVTAALFLSLIKATTDRICRNYALKPQEYLKNLNDELLGNMPMSFLTCIYGVFEYPDSQIKFSFSKGGHLPPVLYRASSGDVIELKSRGMLLGMFDDIKNENTSVLINRGDRIFLYTDGIPETTNTHGEMFGFKRLPELIMRTSSYSLSETLDFVIDDLNRFKGNASLQDDIILIGMEIK